MKYLLRILTVIPVVFVHAVHIAALSVYIAVMYIRYGGESIIYKKTDKATIADIYETLKSKQNNED